jgi:hypothetical protein
VADTTLVDRHMVPPEGIENMQHSDLLNGMSDSSQCDNLPLERQSGEPEDAHVALLLLA